MIANSPLRLIRTVFAIALTQTMARKEGLLRRTGLVHVRPLARPRRDDRVHCTRGAHQFCVYAINTGPPDFNPLLACATG